MTLSAEPPEVVEDRAALYLHDPSHGLRGKRWPLAVRAFTVIASSPDVRNYGFSFKTHFTRRYVHRWEVCELKEAADKLGKAYFDDCYNLRGLVNPTDWRARFAEACNEASYSLTLEQARCLLHVFNGKRGQDSAFSHRIITTVRPDPATGGVLGAPAAGAAAAGMAAAGAAPVPHDSDSDIAFRGFKIVPLSPEIGKAVRAKLCELTGKDTLEGVVSAILGVALTSDYAREAVAAFAPFFESDSKSESAGDRGAQPE